MSRIPICAFRISIVICASLRPVRELSSRFFPRSCAYEIRSVIVFSFPPSGVVTSCPSIAFIASSALASVLNPTKPYPSERSLYLACRMTRAYLGWKPSKSSRSSFPLIEKGSPRTYSSVLTNTVLRFFSVPRPLKSATVLLFSSAKGLSTVECCFKRSCTCCGTAFFRSCRGISFSSASCPSCIIVDRARLRAGSLGSPDLHENKCVLCLGKKDATNALFG
mmetsp:Transcript_1379/g.2992  ORF Transcript_1379/g.2992 Transcript_1379/m.2992 type:complete len:222 (-) Transcript_1379:286-951(-)